MFIDEKLTTVESSRVYIELSKEKINDVKLKMKRIKIRKSNIDIRWKTNTGSVCFFIYINIVG